MRKSLSRLAALLAVTVPSTAFAHTGIGSIAGFGHGFLHPLSGLDHLLTMLSVGMLAYQMGGRALWLLPLTFVSVMALGGALGMAGLPLPAVETGIAISVIALGAAVAFGITLPTPFAVGLVGLFALFHGHAHGAEMPEAMSGYIYGLGFIVATALIQISGIALGAGLGRLGTLSRQPILPVAGGLISLFGVALLTGIA